MMEPETREPFLKRLNIPLVIGAVVTLGAIVFRLWVDPDARWLLDAVTWSMLVGGVGVSLTVGGIAQSGWRP